jgi:hypothetical protein
MVLEKPGRRGGGGVCGGVARGEKRSGEGVWVRREGREERGGEGRGEGGGGG